MKYLIVLSCLLVTVWGGIPPEMLEQIKLQMMEFGTACKDEVGVGGADIALMMKHELPQTREGKCFLACMDKKYGFQDKDGKIDKAAAVALMSKIKPLDEELYGKMMQACNTCHEKVTDAADECDTAYNLMECFSVEYKTLGIKPFGLD